MVTGYQGVPSKGLPGTEGKYLVRVVAGYWEGVPGKGGDRLPGGTQ